MKVKQGPIPQPPPKTYIEEVQHPPRHLARGTVEGAGGCH